MIGVTTSCPMTFTGNTVVGYVRDAGDMKASAESISAALHATPTALRMLAGWGEGLLDGWRLTKLN